jgi:hypothetical protein
MRLFFVVRASCSLNWYEVDGDLSQQGKIADGGAVANPTVILSEGDVEHPVQAVFEISSMKSQWAVWSAEDSFRRRYHSV